ncbi:hypothetical protein Tco_0269590 [Tanacetum coccineum]
MEEEEEEDTEMEEEEEEEMEIDDEMDDPEVINLYEIEEGELPPPPAESDISSNTEPEVEIGVEDETEAATIGTITRAAYHVHPFSSNTYSLAQQMFERANTEYSTLKRLSKMDQYLGELDTDLRSETQERYELKQSVSTLEDQMRGLMLEDRKEKESLKDKLKVVQEEKIMPPKAMSQVVIERLITQRVNADVEAERARHTGGQGSNANRIGGQGGSPAVRECTFVGFMKCNPTVFYGHEGAVATRRLEAANRITWTEMRKLMTEEFWSAEEIQRMEHEL